MTKADTGGEMHAVRPQEKKLRNGVRVALPHAGAPLTVIVRTDPEKRFQNPTTFPRMRRQSSVNSIAALIYLRHTPICVVRSWSAHNLPTRAQSSVHPNRYQVTYTAVLSKINAFHGLSRK